MLPFLIIIQRAHAHFLPHLFHRVLLAVDLYIFVDFPNHFRRWHINGKLSDAEIIRCASYSVFWSHFRYWFIQHMHTTYVSKWCTRLHIRNYTSYHLVYCSVISNCRSGMYQLNIFLACRRLIHASQLYANDFYIRLSVKYRLFEPLASPSLR